MWRRAFSYVHSSLGHFKFLKWQLISHPHFSVGLFVLLVILHITTPIIANIFSHLCVSLLMVYIGEQHFNIVILTHIFVSCFKNVPLHSKFSRNFPFQEWLGYFWPLASVHRFKLTFLNYILKYPLRCA